MAEHKVVNTTQLEADLTSIANAIREKLGVNDLFVFPDGFADAIANIASTPNGISALAAGTITLAEQSSKLTLEHNLGVQPNFYYVRAQETFDSAAHSAKIYTSSGSNLGGFSLSHLAHYTTYDGGGFGVKQVAGSFSSFNDTLYTMGASGFYYMAGCTYHWICGVFETE